MSLVVEHLDGGTVVVLARGFPLVSLVVLESALGDVEEGLLLVAVLCRMVTAQWPHPTEA